MPCFNFFFRHVIASGLRTALVVVHFLSTHTLRDVVTRCVQVRNFHFYRK